MSLKTGILCILFCVALAAVVVGQRLQIRGVGFDAAQHDRELRALQEEHRILKNRRAAAGNPSEMIRRVREHGIELLPPEDKLPEIPGRPAPAPETQRG